MEIEEAEYVDSVSSKTTRLKIMIEINRELSQRRGLFKIHPFDSDLVRDAIVKNPPTVLYHYTDIKGLLGILDSGQLWATDSRFLNDTSEGSHAIELIESVLIDISKVESGRNKSIVDYTLDELKRARQGTGAPTSRFFVASFSSSPDSMYEWRAYGAGGQGVALGCQLKQPQDISTTDPYARDTYWLMKCTYERAQQEAIVRDLCTLAFCWGTYIFSNAWEHKNGATTPSDLARGLAPSLLFLAPAFKRPEFAIENEWRLVRTKPSDPQRICVRQANSGIKAYCEIEIKGNSAVTLGPIIVGNLPEFEITKIAIQDLLVKKGFTSESEGIAIEKSRLVLRY